MSASTSNVRGTIRDASGVLRTNTVIRFLPIQTPLVSGGDIVTSPTLSTTTDVNGQFGYSPLWPMVEGGYRVVISDIDVFTIQVPGDGGTHDIATLGVPGVDPSLSTTGVDPASLDEAIADTTTVWTTRQGDRFAPRYRIFFTGERMNSASDMAALAKSMTQTFPDSGFVVGLGNWNPSGNQGGITAAVTPFSDYASNSAFAYCVGLADRTTAPDYFKSPDDSYDGTYYYDLVIDANVHLFFINSDAQEADGTANNSVQALWLQTSLAASTARWKIVCFNKSPTASKSGYTGALTDWPFADWGASILVCAGANFFERLTYQGLPLFVVGTGGYAFDSFGTPVTGSLLRLPNEEGGLLLDINQHSVETYFAKKTGRVENYGTLNGLNTSQVHPAVRINKHTSLLVDQDHLEVRKGFGNTQLINGSFTNWAALFGGRILRLDALPNHAAVRAEPMLKSCWVLLGDDPTVTYVWSEYTESWIKYIDPAVTTPIYAPGTRPQLAAPSIAFSGGLLSGIVVNHADAGATIYVAVNGSTYTATTPGAVVRFTPDLRGTESWVSAYASKSGYRDSVIVTQEQIQIA